MSIDDCCWAAVRETDAADLAFLALFFICIDHLHLLTFDLKLKKIKDKIFWEFFIFFVDVKQVKTRTLATRSRTYIMRGGGGGEKCQKGTNNGLARSPSFTFNPPSDSTRSLSLSLSASFHSTSSFANYIQQLFKLKRERGKKQKNERVCVCVCTSALNIIHASSMLHEQ